MDLGARAEELFQAGYNCAEAVLLAVLEQHGTGSQEWVRFASAFGGGMARRDVCGAVTGALVALGATRGRVAPDQPKDRLRELTAGFLSEFESCFGTIRCDQLAGDLEGEARRARCSVFVRQAAQSIAAAIDNR